MNDKLLEHLEEILDWAKRGGDFVQEQAPLVVQEIVRWGKYSCIFWMAWCLVFIVLGTIITKRLAAWAKREDPDSTTPLIMAPLVVGFVSLLLIIPLSCNIYEFIYIHAAPRLYILSELSHLLHRG